MATDFRDATRPDAEAAIPPLRNGDRLTSDEFFRRYEAMPGVKAELIDGRVYLQAETVRRPGGAWVVASPVRHRQHGKPHARLIAWLGYYEAATPGVEASGDSTIRLDVDNTPQPDACLRILPERGGQSRETADGYLAGAPELVAEIAASSVNYDLHEKLHVYRRHGVREYVVWRTEDRKLDWFVAREGRYESLPADEAGIVRSETFPGLWLDAAALLHGELATVFRTVDQGVATPEHAGFVAQLAAGDRSDVT